MFSTPLICSSIGATTVEATTSALAPGYWPETLMIGGAISGYCATGRRVERHRAQDHEHDRDHARRKIGRSMKKCDKRMSAAFASSLAGAGAARRRAAALGVLRRHPGPAANARIRPLTMTRSSAPRPSLMTRRLPSTSWPSVTYLLRALFSAVDHQHVLARPARCRWRHPGPAAPDRPAMPGTRTRREHAGREQPVGVGENTARPRMVPDDAGR